MALQAFEFFTSFYGFAALAAVAMLFAFGSQRWKAAKAKAHAETLSDEQKRRIAYDAYEKSSAIRLNWWQTLLLLTGFALFLGFAFGAVWIDSLSNGVNLSDPFFWLILVIVPHLWIYPLGFVFMVVRSLVNLRIARLLMSAADASTELVSAPSSPALPSADQSAVPPFRLDLIYEIPLTTFEKRPIDATLNAFGKPPRTLLYLYDFRMGKTLRRHSIPYHLADYGPVFRIETPAEISLLRSLDLLDSEMLAACCATSLHWVRTFLAKADTGPLPYSRATRPFGRYPEIKFLTVDAIWQQVVLVMFEHVDHVIIDARRFDTRSTGLVWEIESAAERVCTSKLFILADITTRMPDLEACLRSGWARRRPAPYRHDGPVRVLRGGVDPVSMKLRVRDSETLVHNIVYRSDQIVAAGLLP